MQSRGKNSRYFLIRIQAQLYLHNNVWKGEQSSYFSVVFPKKPGKYGNNFAGCYSKSKLFHVQVNRAMHWTTHSFFGDIASWFQEKHALINCPRPHVRICWWRLYANADVSPSINAGCRRYNRNLKQRCDDAERFSTKTRNEKLRTVGFRTKAANGCFCSRLECMVGNRRDSLKTINLLNSLWHPFHISIAVINSKGT